MFILVKGKRSLVFLGPQPAEDEHTCSDTELISFVKDPCYKGTQMNLSPNVSCPVLLGVSELTVQECDFQALKKKSIGHTSQHQTSG